MCVAGEVKDVISFAAKIFQGRIDIMSCEGEMLIIHQKVRADTPSFAYAHYVAGYGEEARCLVYFFLLPLRCTH